MKKGYWIVAYRAVFNPAFPIQTRMIRFRDFGTLASSLSIRTSNLTGHCPPCGWLQLPRFCATQRPSICKRCMRRARTIATNFTLVSLAGRRGTNCGAVDARNDGADDARRAFPESVCLRF
jgi:hypothetical protein